MKTKLAKSLLAGGIGSALSGIGLYGMNPIGMAAYSAIQGSSLMAVPSVPLFLLVVYFCYGLLDTFKYAIVMFLSATFIVSMKYMGENKRKVNVYISAMAAAFTFGLMECTDVFVLRSEAVNYSMVGLATILVFSLTVVFGKLIEILLGEDRIRYDNKARRKEDERDRTEKVAGNYEEKLRMMAESFEKMSKSIDGFGRGEHREKNLNGELDIMNEIWRRRLEDSRNAVALQLKEMSGILKDVTSDSYVFVNLAEEKEEELRRELRAKGILMKNIVILNNRRGIDEVNIILKAGKKTLPLKEVGEIISGVLEKDVGFKKNPYALVNKEYTTYTFVEEPNFFIIHGAAKRSKDQQTVSGDNFTCMELDSGQTLLSVSDGMGHGMQACKESEVVVELLEEMMKGGFSEEASVRLINSILMIDSDIMNPTALDMGIIDMYSGVCDFMKLGAASTFVKRGRWVEAIKSTSLPIGSTGCADIETASKKLYDGDFVIMMSDGIMESIQEEDKEKTIGEIILEIKEGKPEEMAREILKKALAHSDKEKDDDMTVLVTGIWDKCA
ncbi:MAG: SpoIIE family protein phosphatase [Lachnospiraceae bacterium]|mgnify:CR=1 FL=1|nr:SpoIIE family protein phosphatase [Lachnospiraceae bacterium]MCI9368834.1 SpoIIE family protein phosphatase [Lachnospiraceae bacterium]